MTHRQRHLLPLQNLHRKSQKMSQKRPKLGLMRPKLGKI
jgi:hypothetical protein